MIKPMKAAVLSALVYPGLGHFLLKRIQRGLLLAGTTTVCLYLLISVMIERAQQIIGMIERGEVQPDIAAITELLSQQPTGSDAQLLNITPIVLVLCWLAGIIDSYRISKLENSNGKQ